jgi:hypothetical protein
MREMKDKTEDVVGSNLRSSLLDVSDRLCNHCGKIEVILKGFEVKQINDDQFNLKQPFISKKSSLTKTALMNIVENYKSIRQKVREITEMSFVDFEILFPKLSINFETYYSVAISLLNLIYQMQLMRLNCYRLLKS